MPTNLAIDQRLLERAVAVSGEKSKRAAVTKAAEREVLRRFLLRRDADELISQARTQASSFLPATASSADAR